MTEHIYKPLPQGLTIQPSLIHGLGLFADEDFPMSTFFGVSHVHSSLIPGEMIDVTFSFTENKVGYLFEGNHIPISPTNNEVNFYLRKETIFPNGLVRTPLGGFINHNPNGNINLVYMNSGLWGIISNREIKKKEEITIDYQYTPCGVIQ